MDFTLSLISSSLGLCDRELLELRWFHCVSLSFFNIMRDAATKLTGDVTVGYFLEVLSTIITIMPLFIDWSRDCLFKTGYLDQKIRDQKYPIVWFTLQVSKDIIRDTAAI